MEKSENGMAVLSMTAAAKRRKRYAVTIVDDYIVLLAWQFLRNDFKNRFMNGNFKTPPFRAVFARVIEHAVFAEQIQRATLLIMSSSNMTLISNKIPIWKTSSVAVASYLAAIVILTIFTKADEYWTELFATSRFRTGFILYSFPFLAVGALFVAVGDWAPSRNALIILRRAILAVCLLAFIAACFFMVVFGFGFDWKMSI